MSMYLLGTVLILCGVAAAMSASMSYVLVTRGNTAALTYGRLGTRAALSAVLLVVALLLYLFVMRRYDIKYVYDYSSADLEFRFRVASLWAGQPGSFVIWALWDLIVAQFLIRRTRHAEPTTGAAIVPPDGKVLNELLHNPWMVIHPPILFTGYALLAVPFAFALGGLWRRTMAGCSGLCPGHWPAGRSSAARCWAATGPMKRLAGVATGAGIRSR